MKKPLVVIAVLMLSALQIFPANTVDRSGSQSTSMDVVFTATPFVRVGFSSAYVGSPVEPSDDLKRNIAGFKNEGGDRIITDFYYLYAQAFTPDPVTVSISDASPLGSGSNTYHWSAGFLPFGEGATGSEITVDSQSNPATGTSLLNEESSEGDGYSPRSYCWRFRVELVGAPSQPTEVVEQGSFTVTIASK